MKLLAAVMVIAPLITFLCGIGAANATSILQATFWMLGFACFWGTSLAAAAALLTDFKSKQ